MARRVFFHIGAPKTGTTYLQTILWSHRKQLRQQGLLYPGDKRMDHFHASEVVRDTVDTSAEEGPDAWERLLGEIRAWPHTGLISHEFFCAATADQASRAVAALAPAEVHLVLTARDYVRQFPAVWQESLKMRFDDGFSEFMARAQSDQLEGPWSWLTQDVSAILQRWGRDLAPERVHVVTVPRSGAPRDLLWRRFAMLLGIDPESCDSTLAVPNESLGVAGAALLRRVKPKLSPPLTGLQERHRWVRAFYAQSILVPLDNRRFGMRKEEEAALRERSRTMVDDVVRAGYDVVGDLDELVPPDDLPDLPHPDDVADSELLDVATTSIVEMLARHREVALERNDLRARAVKAEREANRAKREAQAAKREAQEAERRGQEAERAAQEMTARVERLERRRLVNVVPALARRGRRVLSRAREAPRSYGRG